MARFANSTLFSIMPLRVRKFTLLSGSLLSLGIAGGFYFGSPVNGQVSALAQQSVLAATQAATQEGTDRQSTGSEQTGEAQQAMKILREGTKLNMVAVSCRVAGDRLEVELEDSRRILALENLASQRVWQAVRDDHIDANWIISGSITEFQAQNFVLIERVSRVPR